MRPWSIGALLSLFAALFLATAARADTRSVSHTQTLDLAGALHDPTQAAVSFPFAARSDEVLTSAEVRLTFTKADLSNVHGLEVLVSSERIAQLTPEEIGKTAEPHIISIPSQNLSDRNLLTLRLATDSDGPCASVPAGTWKFLKAAELSTESSPLPLPSDLALLPLPFIDRGFDKDATVPVVFATEPTPDRVRLAGIVAGWLGMDNGLPLKFPVRVGELPETSAIVFVDSAEQAAALGLPAPEGATARLIDNPKVPGSNVKLLVLSGSTPEELERAVRNVSTGTAPLAGEKVRFDNVPPVTTSAPYDAPRWLPSGAVPFGQFPRKNVLTHQGSAPGTISVKFRVAPDLWTWPVENVVLDLGYTEATPIGTKPPRLDVEFNGVFLATLPELPPSPGEMTGRAQIRIRSEQLRGFNELLVHVAYPGVDACNAQNTDDVHVSITPDSRFRLEGFSHFANMPDVASFVHDGFPFTRVADMGETALVLPNRPEPAEIGSALSLLAHFASVTGTVGTRLTVLSADQFLANPRLDKDVLLVGLPSDHTALRRWADLMPLQLGSSGGQLQMPAQNNVVLRFLSGRMGHSEMRRAQPVVSGSKGFAAVMGWESPARPGRSVVAVTATSTAKMPSIEDMSGFANARSKAGDLLVSSGNGRWMFRIGPSYDVGTLKPWTQTRWQLANHWLVLFPAVLLGAVVLAARVKRGLDERTRERMS